MKASFVTVNGFVEFHSQKCGATNQATHDQDFD